VAGVSGTGSGQSETVTRRVPLSAAGGGPGHSAVGPRRYWLPMAATLGRPAAARGDGGRPRSCAIVRTEAALRPLRPASQWIAVSAECLDTQLDPVRPHRDHFGTLPDIPRHCRSGTQRPARSPQRPIRQRTDVRSAGLLPAHQLPSLPVQEQRRACAQQSNTDQQISFRNRWSSRTSSRIASGSWSRCHWHSSRPAAPPSPSAAAACAALIA
jgi:hypothetical protein